jgi:hypothetical protein
MSARIAAGVGNIVGVAARCARRREGAGSEAVAIGSAIALGDAVVGQVALADRGGHAGGRIDIGAATGEGGGGVVLFGGGGLIGAGVGAIAVGIGFLIVIGHRAAVGIDFGEAAGVAGSTIEADVGNAAPFGAGVAIGSEAFSLIVSVSTVSNGRWHSFNQSRSKSGRQFGKGGLW